MLIFLFILALTLISLLFYIVRIIKLTKLLYSTAKSDSYVIILKNSKILYCNKSIKEIFEKHGIDINDFKNFSYKKINFYTNKYPFLKDFFEKLSANFKEKLFEYETTISFSDESYKIKFRREKSKTNVYSVLLITNVFSNIKEYTDELISSIYKIPEEFFNLTTSDTSTYELVDYFFNFLSSQNIIDSLAVGIRQIDGSINIIYGKIGDRKLKNFIVKDKTLISYVIDTGKKLYVKNLDEINFPKEYKLMKIIDKPYSMYGIPLLIEKKVFGAVLFEKEGINKFTLKDFHLFEILAFLISISIKLKNEYQILYKSSKENLRKAIIDPLTNAYNRNYLYEILYKKPKKEKSKYKVVIFLDLDNFKYINDKYGHIYGDKVLKNFVKITKRVLRRNDLIIRYGGDEFLILLHNSNIENSESVIQRIRKMVLDSEFKVDFSYGLMYFDPEKNIEENIKIVDRKMYEMKSKKKT
ncbi:sensor domain-containing diguanylate cyclase [Thermosipho globiformans]|uniref:sensor domain-containing diguanylate cyclase n=1 Tax=Thermosipho globiformans TaxID=380685 RepID=UPI000F8C633A|nr:sensor domain-containing diguanylate cyclase [Thermosipho globiformans]